MVKNKKDIKKNIKRQNMIQLSLSLLIIILINIISSFVFTRIDLTSEKRYTLSPATKNLLKNLKDIVFFRVYLEGEFPAGFKRLHNETKEMLDEFRAYSGNIQYEFVNPSANKDGKATNDTYKLLMEKGLEPTNLQVKSNGGTSQQIIFPAAIVAYKDRELPLQLLMTQMGAPAEEQLNNSIRALEYNLSNTIRKLTVVVKPKVAFIEGQGELNDYETADIANSLSEYYNVERIKINGNISSLRQHVDTNSGKVLNKYEAIIIAKPDSAFDEKDKFLIDQYVMNGGKILWLVDPVFASQDSLQKSSFTFGIAKPLNIEDMLFKYGVRLNYNLILDLNSMPIPVRTGEIGGQPQFSFIPWLYFPVITPVVKHPIVNNLNAVKTEFVSSMDTVEAPGVKKTILLTSSAYSKTLNVPVRISLDLLRKNHDERQFNEQNLAVAILLEGKFTSLYNHRIPPEILSSKGIAFKPQSEKTAMIVISDGDIIKNQVRVINGKQVPYPLGYDRYTKQTFGNKDFILNAVNYLCDNSGLISVRTREVKLRLLDKTRVENNKLSIQLFNTLLPLAFIILLGIILNIYRKRKYTKTRDKE